MKLIYLITATHKLQPPHTFVEGEQSTQYDQLGNIIQMTIISDLETVQYC